jgi:hypothetical protein
VQLKEGLGSSKALNRRQLRRLGVTAGRVGGLGADIVSTRNGRTQTHRVIIGPLPTVQQADMVLDQVLRSGVTDARIVVE